MDNRQSAIGNRQSAIGRGGLGVLALIVLAAPLHGQLTRHATFSLSGGNTRLTAVTGIGTATFSGLTLGGIARIGTGRIAGGRLSVEGGYRQGSLAPDSGATTAQDLVEGHLMLAVRPVPWLSVLAGPHARAFVAPSGTERWLFLEARVRAEGTVVNPAVRTHVEVWAALGGSVNVGTGSPSARGGEAGLTVQLPRSPVWARLAYGMDRAAQSGTTNVRTVEDIRVSIGIGK